MNTLDPTPADYLAFWQLHHENLMANEQMKVIILHRLLRAERAESERLKVEIARLTDNTGSVSVDGLKENQELVAV